MKKTEIIFLFLYILINQVYSQPSERTSDSTLKPMSQNSAFVYIYGRFEVFPSDSLDRMQEMTANVQIGDTSKWKGISLQKNGEFHFLSEKSKTETISINISDRNFSRKRPYYPVEIKNVNFDRDTLYLGIIPTMPDPFGYYGEWGNSIKKHFFDRKVYFYTNEVMFLEKRLKYEDTLNNIYNSFCWDCDSIFTTKVVTWSKKQHTSREEIRKLTINHRDLLSMSEYFSFNYPHHDSLARGFVNFMKRIPDSCFTDRFNKAVDNYIFPKHYHTPDSIIIYTSGQILRYEEDSIPVIYFPNHPGLNWGVYDSFKKEVLKTIDLSKEETSRINNELLFLIEVDYIGRIKELKLLTLTDSDTRHRLDAVLTRFSHYRFVSPKSRVRSHGFKAALYIDLSDKKY